MHLSGVEVFWRSPPESPFPNHHRHHTCKTEAGAVHTSQCVSLGTYLHILIGLFLIILLIITIFLQIKFPFGMYSHMREWHLQWISCWNAVDPLKCLWSQGPLQFYRPLAGLVGTSAHVIEPNLDLGSSHTPPHKRVQAGCNTRTLWNAPAILVTPYWACWHLSSCHWTQFGPGIKSPGVWTTTADLSQSLWIGNTVLQRPRLILIANSQYRPIMIKSLDVI